MSKLGHATPTKSLKVKPRNILVIAMPYLGDVLLATPLFSALKTAYPDTKIDVLVFQNTAAMLEGNPDINTVITTPNRPSLKDNWLLVKKIFRRYDLAIAIQTGDRPFFYTLLAAPFRVNAVPPKTSKTGWKRFFVQRWTEFDNENTHTVLQHLKLLDLMKVPRYFALTPPQLTNNVALLERFPFLKASTPFVLIHPFPQWTYKQWTLEGWVSVGRYLNKLGYIIVVSGGTGQEELNNIACIVEQLPVDTINLAGQVSLAELTYIISKAKLFIGPDTGITHLAAATGIPVIALFGPTNPVKWAPWPFNYQQTNNPFDKVGTKTVNNVTLVQGEAECVPCHLDGCDRHRGSRSACLDSIPVSKIKKLSLETINGNKLII